MPAFKAEFMSVPADAMDDWQAFNLASVHGDQDLYMDCWTGHNVSEAETTLT